MYIKVKVTAGAKKENIEKVSDDHYKISVKQRAERNMANNRVIEILADVFSINIKQVRIINGHHSPSKMFSIDM
jgi:uncharacterized protein YggU (UPF0235/DUF167 family)